MMYLLYNTRAALAMPISVRTWNDRVREAPPELRSLIGCTTQDLLAWCDEHGYRWHVRTEESTRKRR